MPANWTPLHRELGLNLRPLTLGDVHAAVDQRIVEGEDLDWKQSLPHPERRDDFASDVAALANSGGGLIVIGVREDSATSAAAEITPIDVSDQTRRNLTQTVTAIIRPRIPNLELVPLTTAEDTSSGVLLVFVRRSSSAPHLIERRGEVGFRAPFRQGSATQWMNEAELARSYATRFDSQSVSQHRHLELLRDARNRVSRDGLPWIIATGVPSDPVPLELQRELTIEDRETLMSSANLVSTRLLTHDGAYRVPLVSRLQPSHDNQRRGPRAWMTRYGHVRDEPGMTSDAFMMLYEDGSVSLATQGYSLHQEGELGDGSKLVPVYEVESLAADFAALSDLYAALFGNSAVTITIGELFERTTSDPVYAVDVDRSWRTNTWRRSPGSIRLDEVRTVAMDFQPGLGETNRRQLAEDLARALLEQFGISQFSLFSAEDAAVSMPMD